MSQFSGLRIVFPVLLVLVAFGVACGGSSDTKDASTATGPISQGQSNSTSTPDSSSSSGLAPDTSAVTIGEKRYEFSMSGPFGDQCLTLFGVVAGVGQAENGSDVSVEIEIPPVGYASDPRYAEMEPPSIRVRDDVGGMDWQAGGDFSFLGVAPGPGQSQIDSYENDGTSASGTATFIDMTAMLMSRSGTVDAPKPVKGTFEISCN